MFEWLANKFIKKQVTQTVIKESGVSGAVWSDENFENFAKEAFLRCVVANRCIREISDAVGSVPWGVFELNRKGEKVPIQNHPIEKLLKRPNPEQGWSAFIQKMWGYYKLDGNTFIRRISPVTGRNTGVYSELHVLRPDRIKILEEDGILTGYEYKIGTEHTVIFPVNNLTGQADVLQIKTFHPTDDWWGAAATKIAAREIDTLNEAVVWNKSLLQNQGRPGLIYNFENTLEDKEYERFKKRLEEQFSGPKNVGKNIVVDGKANVAPYGFTMNDLDFIEGQQELARRVCMVYDVPPVVLGIQDATFNNESEGRLKMYEGPVINNLNLIKTEFNNWLFNDDREFIDYILDDVPALALRRQINWENAQKTDFITINEKRAMVGKKPVQNGDVLLVDASKIPLDFAVLQAEEPVEPDTADFEDDEL